MEIAVATIETKSVNTTFSIHHLTDLHCDDPDFAEKEFLAKVQEIADDPHAYWIGGGDYGSLILPNDPRFQTGDLSVHRLPDVYIETVSEYLMPIRGKCLGFGTGNHEWTIGKHYHRGVGAEVCRNLGIQHLYLGSRGWIVLKLKNNSRYLAMKGFQYHGWSSGRLKGRKSIQAERDLGAWNADAFFLGHDHVPYSDIWYTEEIRGHKSGWTIHQRPRAFINGGSWTYGHTPPMKNKTGRKASEFPNDAWVEGRNFRPQPPSPPTLLVHVDFGSRFRSAGFDFEIRQRGNRY